MVKILRRQDACIGFLDYHHVVAELGHAGCIRFLIRHHGGDPPIDQSRFHQESHDHVLGTCQELGDREGTVDGDRLEDLLMLVHQFGGLQHGCYPAAGKEFVDRHQVRDVGKSALACVGGTEDHRRSVLLAFGNLTAVYLGLHRDGEGEPDGTESEPAVHLQGQPHQLLRIEIGLGPTASRRVHLTHGGSRSEYGGRRQFGPAPFHCVDDLVPGIHRVKFTFVKIYYFRRKSSDANIP